MSSDGVQYFISVENFALNQSFERNLNMPSVEKLDALESSVNYMEKNQEVGACTGRLFYNNNKQQPNVKTDPTLLSQLLIYS